MKLVENWRSAWRWISVNCMVMAAALQGAWAYIPEDMKASLPPDLVRLATIALLAVGVAGRLVQQTPNEAKK